MAARYDRIGRELPRLERLQEINGRREKTKALAANWPGGQFVVRPCLDFPLIDNRSEPRYTSADPAAGKAARLSTARTVSQCRLVCAFRLSAGEIYRGSNVKIVPSVIVIILLRYVMSFRNFACVLFRISKY